jgi:hypothetical protein
VKHRTTRNTCPPSRTSQTRCTCGDFNCDGVVDFDDLVLLAQLYNVDLTP